PACMCVCVCVCVCVRVMCACTSGDTEPGGSIKQNKVHEVPTPTSSAAGLAGTAASDSIRSDSKPSGRSRVSLELRATYRQRGGDQLLRNVLVASEKAHTLWGSETPFCFFDKEMEQQMFREEEITSELMHLASGEGSGSLFLQYQPIYDVASESICGFEALARLKTPSLGLISPLEFIPITEKTKLIIPLGETIFLQAFRFLNRLRDQGCTQMSVSVNVSAIQLLRHDFIPSLQRMIKAMQIDARYLVLEITESVFASNYQEINRILGQLQKIGIQIAMDDFGTGYSSLARERELNVNCLKIDKFFIDKLMVLSDDEAISGDIISMAHKLGHCVVAEGIEHERQLAYLRRFHCDKIQGYLISRPLDEEAALALAKEQLTSHPSSN
ncbi:MAG: EAL domain-containing protein, partial [Spirochaetia bacterium]|nr:EAL domain-containing protein [Spirochaetia bacterium]